MHEIKRIERAQKRLQLGQGEIMRIAAELTGQEVVSLYDLTPAQLTGIVCYLDQLELIGA